MDLNNKRKKCIKIDRETGSDRLFAVLYEVNSDLEDDINNLMNDLDSEFVLKQSLGNVFDSDVEPLNLLVPEGDYHVDKNPTIEKGLGEASSKVQKEEKGKSKEKLKGKENDKGKKIQRVKSGESEFDWGKNMLHMQKNNIVWKLVLSISSQNTTSLLVYFLL